MSREASPQGNRPTPWTAADAQLFVVLGGSGLLVTAFGWFLVSGRATYESQMDALGIGILGVVLAGFGTLFWIVAGRRAVAERVTWLLTARVEVRGSIRATGEASRPAIDHGLFVAGNESTFFHVAECGLARGRGWQPAHRNLHEQAGRLPCGVCIR
jgi:hypothetical protein